MRSVKRLPGCIVPVFLIMYNLHVPCVAGDTLSDYEYDILKICEGVNQLFKQHQESIWPGFNLAGRPFIVYIPGKWALLFNHDRKVDGFESYPEDWPGLGARFLYHKGRYKELAGQLVFNFEVDTIRTVAIGFPEKLPGMLENWEVEGFGYIVHEAFHQYQRNAFGEIPWAREEKYPINDTGNAALAYLEMLLLIDALEAAKDGNRGACIESAKHYVAVRSHRWQNADPFVADYEQGLELNEATARYVEVKSIDLMKRLEYKSSLDGIRGSLKENFLSISMPGYLMRDFKERMGDGFIRTEDMPRNRIYPVGSALGFLLDYFEIDWKERAEQGGPDFVLTGLLGENLGIGEIEFDRLLNEAKHRYGYENILKSTVENIDAYHRDYEHELAAFDSQSGYRIEIDIVARNVSRSRFTKAKKWVVDQGTHSLCSHYEVYTLKTESLNLQVHRAGLFEENNWDSGKKKVVFYIPEIDSVSLDGRPYTLADDSRQLFENMEMLGENLKLTVTGAGTVSYSRGVVEIDLNRIPD